MNRTVSAIALAALFAFGVPRLSADLADKIEKRPLPSGPVIQRAPAFAKWTIAFVYPKGESGSEPARRLQTLTVTKTKDVYYEVKMYSDGTRRESWHVGGLQISTPPGSSTYAVYEAASFSDSNGDPSLYTDYSKTDFPAVGWISAENYQGILKVREADQLVFQQSLQSIVPEMGFGMMLLTACVDAQTRLPVWVQSRDAILTYQFNTPPQTAIALPPEVRQLLEKRSKAVKAMTSSVPSF